MSPSPESPANMKELQQSGIEKNTIVYIDGEPFRIVFISSQEVILLHCREFIVKRLPRRSFKKKDYLGGMRVLSGTVVRFHHDIRSVLGR